MGKLNSYGDKEIRKYPPERKTVDRCIISYTYTSRTYVTCSRGRREHILVGLMAAIRAAITPLTSYVSPSCEDPNM